MIITQTQIARDFTSYDGKIIEVYHQPILDMDRSKFDPIQIRYYKQFKNLRDGIHSGDWFLDKDWKRTYCREFYQTCFSDTPNIPTHLMSKRAMNKLLLKGGSFDVLTEDHFQSPQFATNVIMFFPEKYLFGKDAWENFCKFVDLMRRTIWVTPDENKALSKLTSNTKENGTRIICKASHKYEHLNIQLVKRKNTSIRTSKDKKSWFDVETVSNVFTDIPSDYVEVEEQFLLKD